MNKYNFSLLLASSVMLTACVSNPPNLSDVAANAAAGGTGNTTNSLLGALAVNAIAGGKVNSGNGTGALLGALAGGSAQAVVVNQDIDPGPYAKSSCKSLQGEYRKLTPKVKQNAVQAAQQSANKAEPSAASAGQALGLLATLTGNQQMANTVQQTSALAGNVQGATGTVAALNPNQLKIAQIESAATSRNCAITRGDGSKYSATPVALAPVQAVPANPSGAMAALSVASALSGNGNMGNLGGGSGAAGSVGGALLGSFLGAGNQAALPTAVNLGAYAKMDCKALQKDYSKLNVKAVPAQGGVADKLASGGAAIGLLGALTGNRDLANMAQQASALQGGAKPAETDDNLKKIQMVASAKGCALI